MKIQLPGFVIADLYKDSLVITDEVNSVGSAHMEEEVQNLTTIEEPEAEPVLYLGSNAKGIIVLVNNPEPRFLDDESLQLLSNMLGALQLNLDDIALVNLHHTLFTFKELATQFTTRVCLLFGVSTQDIQLPFQMPDYKVQNYDGCKFLCSASLDKMKGAGKEAKVEKTKLWMCLKTLFE